MTVDEALMQAMALTQAGRLAEAEQLYRQVLGAVPDHPVALARLAGIAIAFGHGEAALRLAQRAVSVEESGDTYTALGSVLRELGALDEAHSAFEKVLELALHEPAAHCNLAMVLWQQKKLEPCIRAYERALELDPNFA